MIIFTILLLTLIILLTVVVAVVSAIGAAGIVIFGDVIVCIVFIALIMRFLIKRRKGR
jgi:hypothetical protein